ncbi:MAG: hypothetical protein V3V00_00850 [Saprospiraceae bacterium]
MKKTILIGILILAFFSANITAQYVTPPPPPNAKEIALTEQALVSLKEILNSPENVKMKAQIQEDVNNVTALSSFSVKDYNKLETSYTHLSRLYNNLYLAEMKLNLSNYRQFNRLSQNPERQAKKFVKNHNDVIAYYEKGFFPIVSQIIRKNSDISADGYFNPPAFAMVTASLQLLELGARSLGNLFKGIKNAKRKRQSLAKNFIDQANHLFEESQMPKWGSLGIYPPQETAGSNGNRDYQKNDNRNTDDNYAPPVDIATVESVSGQIYFEVYDVTNDYDAYMPIQQGKSNDVVVNDYSNSDASFDLKIGGKKNKRSLKRATSVTPFGTINSYPAGTLYRVKSTGNGFVYVFSINSGNKMYGIFPYQGETELLPSGTNYSYPDNAYFQEDGTVSISIPDGEYYIEISDSPGLEMPTEEKMIVLCSRSQIDMRDVLTQMETMSPAISPEERLAKIFGSLSASVQDADAYVNDGVLSYALNEDDPSVLSLVFGIRRQ